MASVAHSAIGPVRAPRSRARLRRPPWLIWSGTRRAYRRGDARQCFFILLQVIDQQSLGLVAQLREGALGGRLLPQWQVVAGPRQKSVEGPASVAVSRQMDDEHPRLTGLMGTASRWQ